MATTTVAATVTAYVAIGTNLGNRASNLHRAVQELNAHAGRVVRTSLLYTTSPQYVTDQPQFLNAVLELSTSLSAVDLLLCFKDIEVRVGRVLGTLRYGPRVLDVDILFYGTHVVHATTAVGPLIIPHALLHERDFVLRPLLDLAADFVHPILQQTIRTLHAALPVPTNPPIPVLSLGPHDLLWPLHTKTYVMGIVNATPDSFSGDGVGVDVTAALAAATAMVDQGADMLDIGGESTKPHAPVVSIDDEIARVVPVLRAIRHAFPLLPLSIDTTKARVAAAAIEAGANMVNDVSGATADSNMLATVAAAQVPIVLMHMRGTPATMTFQKV
ncbi:dihydropteroate synthase, variant 2 [Aphanomyces astaci]|uniref:Dihydropteroate synthase, variant 1 n=1 Tax=Aphanomyces astaci TaxID=112090 RepID=W4FAW8_APHAT|nr:dihydropteroate synthase, variant 1 [Aphanomyces astaci]XP_009845921.1 dihydropteroate synthase, variant 2 [Aphanomyces astaci]ETV64596.1 dihydropteroate synthase, variant 1 [Aphanomyces astaci]ETV64597.1 dihydropteroate synthase, variant 2 [Aphanomyces astaci]|eukprot:XP_009845920.1 dihydropteroate synthase, variant 1 [Aphanomyces astaci]